MNLFITGSDSFVGRELRRQCHLNGIDYCGIDLHATGERCRSMSILESGLAAVIPDDVDAVIHLAAVSRDADCRKNAVNAFETNVMGTLNVMEAAFQRGVRQFIFASSEWVYGPADGELTEDTPIDVMACRSEYALSKIVSEVNLRQRCDREFCTVTILRFGIIYGPRPCNWSAVEALLSRVANDERIEVGSLETCRSFVHVSDIARGIVAAVGLDGFQILNLGGDKPVTLNDIVVTSSQITGKRPEVVETAADQPHRRAISSQRAAVSIGWKPEVDLETGLRGVLQSWE